MLPGAGEDAPTVVITAHYDSYGLAPVRADTDKNEKTLHHDISGTVSKALPLFVPFPFPHLHVHSVLMFVFVCENSGCLMEQTLTAVGSPSY